MRNTIGTSYISSIGRSYDAPDQNRRMRGNTSKGTFWDRLTDAVREAGKRPTQTVIAGLCGIKQGSVAEWKAGTSYPRLDNGLSLAVALNVCVEWLYTGRGPKRPPPIDEEGQRLWLIWQTLPEIEKARVVSYAEGRQENGGDPTAATDRHAV